MDYHSRKEPTLHDIRVLDQFYETRENFDALRPDQGSWEERLPPETLQSGRFRTLRAAWKFYKEDLLFHKNCQFTQVFKGRYGRIHTIKHLTPRKNQRPCEQCEYHRQIDARLKARLEAMKEKGDA